MHAQCRTYMHSLFCLFFLYLGCSTCLLRSTRSIMTYCYGVLRPPLVFEIAVIQWLSSFLRGRTQQVIFNNPESTIAKVTSRVPQGSVLGTLLFLLYTADISVFAMEHNLRVHCYADDKQLYVFDKAGSAYSVVPSENACIAEIDMWMSSNRLKLNLEKTQFI